MILNLEKNRPHMWTLSTKQTTSFHFNLIFQLFIILKKKNSHLTFLHCYHHFCMVVGIYAAARWVPGGHGILLGFVNLFVHAFMYFYYFLTAFKPELKKSIWWKKNITQFQLVIIKFCRSTNLINSVCDASVSVCNFDCRIFVCVFYSRLQLP